MNIGGRLFKKSPQKKLTTGSGSEFSVFLTYVSSRTSIGAARRTRLARCSRSGPRQRW
jgi:hypothetical protein